MQSSRILTHVLFLLVFRTLVKDILCKPRVKEEENAETPSPRSAVGEDTCTPPSAKSGACVPLISCRSYWGRGMPDVTNSSCGNETSSKVCCPLAEDDETTVKTDTTIMEVVSTPLPTTADIPTTSPEDNSTASDWRPRRFRSFPENCGQSGATFRRIVGGQDSALGAWPWMAVLYLIRRGNRQPECGGVLITTSHVLTAAHCVVTSRRGQTFSPRQLLVRLGELDLDSDNDGANPIDIKVRTIIRHDKFSLRTFQHDIAILELEQSVNIDGDISPICVPFTVFLNDDLAERNAIVAGWGSTRFDGPVSSRLQEVQIRVWRNDLCREIFRRDVPITNQNLCAGDGDKDACRGDSGGPLMLSDSSGRFYVIGIVSFGRKCAEPGIPGVYTRVTTFLDWIEAKIA